MGCVLYCIGTCRRIMVGGSNIDIADGVDETASSGTFICDECDKNNLADKSHPFYKFSKTEKQIKETGGYWSFHPVENVLP